MDLWIYAKSDNHFILVSHRVVRNAKSLGKLY